MKKLWILLLSIMLTIAFAACNKTDVNVNVVLPSGSSSSRVSEESSIEENVSSAEISSEEESVSSAESSSEEENVSSAEISSEEESEENSGVSIEVNSGWIDVIFPPPKA